MGDGVNVGTRRKLGVARAAQSFTRDEVLLLKRVLESQTIAEPAYQTLLSKASAMAARVAEPANEGGLYARVLTRNSRIAADCEAAMRGGRVFDVGRYARQHGLTKVAVWRATKAVRAAAERDLAPGLADEMYGAYRLLRAAKLWCWELAPLLANHFRAPVVKTTELVSGWSKRFLSETLPKQRRVAHEVERATALLRELRAPRYDSHMEAAE